jgi:hypothetical protein
MTDPATVAGIERALGARRVGPAMWGEIYRSRRTGTYLRVIPNGTRGLTAQRRHELDGWPQLEPRQGLAPVSGSDQRGLLRDQWYHCIEYEIDGEPLAGVLADGRAEHRAAAAARVLLALPVWWRALDEGLLPMAGDVVLVGGEPRLLRIPRWGMPGPAALLDEPSRALHLAPELVRGRAAAPDRAADLVAVGSALLGLAFRPDARHGATALQRVATGTAFDAAHRAERLPAWTTQVPAIGRGVSELSRLVAVDPAERRATELDELADLLLGCAAALDPVTSVRTVREARGNAAALELAREALRDERSYDLDLIAAALTANPLSALTFLEEAVRADPTRPEAYASQFRLITRLRAELIVMLSRNAASFTERLDHIMSEAFARFGPADQDEQTPAMADYLIARGRPGAATRLLLPTLVEGDGTKRWRKPRHKLAYGRAFLAAGRCPEARRIATEAGADLDRARRTGGVATEIIAHAGLELRDLEQAIDRQCGDGS